MLPAGLSRAATVHFLRTYGAPYQKPPRVPLPSDVAHRDSSSPLPSSSHPPRILSCCRLCSRVRSRVRDVPCSICPRHYYMPPWLGTATFALCSAAWAPAQLACLFFSPLACLAIETDPCSGCHAMKARGAYFHVSSTHLAETDSTAKTPPEVEVLLPIVADVPFAATDDGERLALQWSSVV
ncbi:hypothetical protein J3F83DRAFT_640127 [Trichoderma novae-zelandiae]